MADLIDILQEDHDEARSLLRHLTETTSDEQRKELFRELVEQLARHETAEEEVVYPALRRMEGGSPIADARIEEEASAERLLADMEKLDVSDPTWASKMEVLGQDVEEHARNEEQQVFPKLRDGIDADDLQRLGKILEAAKGMAPTHPHPNVPNTAMAKLTAGPFAAVADRTRDLVRRAVEETRR